MKPIRCWGMHLNKFPPRSTVANKTEVPKGMSGGGTVFAMILVWIPNLSLQSNTLSKYIQSQQQKRKNLVKDLFAKIFNGFLPLTAFTKIHFKRRTLWWRNKMIVNGLIIRICTDFKFGHSRNAKFIRELAKTWIIKREMIRYSFYIKQYIF